MSANEIGQIIAAVAAHRARGAAAAAVRVTAAAAGPAGVPRARGRDRAVVRAQERGERPTSSRWSAPSRSIVILADGGLRCGYRAFRRVLAPVLALGVGGTLITFALVADARPRDRRPALVGRAASSAPCSHRPTRRRCSRRWRVRRARIGRIGRVLEGEAGLNDPIAIALAVQFVDVATRGGERIRRATSRVTMVREAVDRRRRRRRAGGRADPGPRAALADDPGRARPGGAGRCRARVRRSGRAARVGLRRRLPVRARRRRPRYPGARRGDRAAQRARAPRRGGDVRAAGRRDHAGRSQQRSGGRRADRARDDASSCGRW